MGEVRSAEEAARRSTVRSRRSAAFAIWYLRVVSFINFLSAVWVTLGQDLRRHNTENYFTPYLLTAGFSSGVIALFLAVTMRRRKRAAWIVNMVLGGLVLLALILAFFFAEIRQHAQNWVSLALTAAFVVALVLGRREFYAKGDRSNPKLAALVAVVGLLVTSLIATALVTVTNTAHDDYRSTFLDRWRYGALRLISVAADDSRFPGISTPGWVNVVINILSTLLLIAVVYAAFRSRRAVDPLSPRTRRSCAPCWTSTATGTRSATSRCAGRRAPCGPRPGRPPWSTGWSAGSRWPPATRSATQRPGPARSTRGSRRPGSTAGSRP